MVLPSQVTPQNLVPGDLPTAPSAPAPISLGAQAPAGAQSLRMKIGRILVEGGFPEFSADTAAVVAAAQNRETSVAALYATARTVEQIYARAGYVLARVVVPPQRLSPGEPVRLAVIDGFIDSVDVKGVPERLRAVVAARTAELVGRRHVTMAEIERAVLIAGDAPGLQLKSALARGESEGGARLVLEGEGQLVSGSIGADSKLPNSLGRREGNTSLSLNGALGWGEQIYLTFGSGFARDGRVLANSPLWLGGGGFILPVGADGWTINPEYTHSFTHPYVEQGEPDAVGSFDRFSLRAAAPLIWSRSQTLKLRGAIEYTEQVTYLPDVSADLNHDAYGALRVGLNWRRPLWPYAQFMADAQFSQGVGGRDLADAVRTGIPLSRQGATPYFSKLETNLSLSQGLPDDFRLDGVAKAQVSFARPLFVSEQFALDGGQGLTAASSGAMNADTGATLRVELGRPFNLALAAYPMSLAPYVYGAGGWGRICEPTAVERPQFAAAAAGAGLRLDLDANNSPRASLQLEWARRYSDLPPLRAANVGSVAASVSF